ncbi:CYIR protein, partial [Plasmodium cynomolgi strain B]
MYSYFENGQKGCESLDFYSNISEEFKQTYQLYNLKGISDKILKALCFIYNRKGNRQNNFDNEYCSYLYYWLGDKIYPKVNNKAVFSRIINMIYEELYRSIPEYFIVCPFVYAPIDKVIFNKNKLLFDYSKDYVNIELDTAHDLTTCDEKYYNYINQYISTYKEAYSDCYNGEGKNLDCSYFSTLFKIEHHEKLSSYKCIQCDKCREFTEVKRGPEEQPSALAKLVPQDRARTSNIYLNKTRDSGLSRINILDSSENTETTKTIKKNYATEGRHSKTLIDSVVEELRDSLAENPSSKDFFVDTMSSQM